MAAKSKFTPEQQTAHDQLKALISDPAKADPKYDRLPGSSGGRIISTDIARFLDRRYAATPLGEPRDILPSWDLAWRYAQGRLLREIRNRKNRKVIRFMAGGWAAGKTHALENEHSPDLAWDGTLKDPEWASETIDLALENRWRVEIAYVHRDLELSFYGAIERALKERRSVPLDEIPAIHRAVQLSVSKLVDRYFQEDEVSFLLLHNVGTREVKSTPLPIVIADLESGGALHYTLTHESYFAKAAKHLASAAGG